MASYGDFRVETQETLTPVFLLFASSNYSGIASLLISERKETPNRTSTTPSDSKKVQDQEQGHIIKSSHISDGNEDTITASQGHGKQLSHEIQKPINKVQEDDMAIVENPMAKSPKTKKPSFFESFHVLKDPQFMSLTLAELTASIGYLIPYYYMQSKFPIKKRNINRAVFLLSAHPHANGNNPCLMPI